MKKTVFVHFSNHFDLVWRRCWERSYVYQGKRYLSYREVEDLCILENIRLAERGEGAYVLEQALSLRAFLARSPDAIDRLKSLYTKGLFEMLGAGEAIIDVNMCQFETMCRNLASGIRYCGELFGERPPMACHNDGFGSSAQFPQVIRKCGLRGIGGMSYSQPDNDFWRGLDGSTVFYWKGAPGRGYFFDHCYHEPCRICRGFGELDGRPCASCRGLCVDVPQNSYPPFEPVPSGQFRDGMASYSICSEEMLPPENPGRFIEQWAKEHPDVEYRWGTPRHLRKLWDELDRLADCPPAGRISSKVENNPVQTGCLVSRARIKRESRFCESVFYGWETALAVSGLAPQCRAEMEKCFLELPLFFFHDAVTGTHQDEAYMELLDRMAAMRCSVENIAVEAFAKNGVPAEKVGRPAPGVEIGVFSPSCRTAAMRAPIKVPDFRNAEPLVAVDEQGCRHPVVYQVNPWSPAQPLLPSRLVASVGPAARTRPSECLAHIEADDLKPLEWNYLRLERAEPPRITDGNLLENKHLSVALGENGVEAVKDLASGATAGSGESPVGHLVLEEDEGDPWGTRKKPEFRRSLAPFTRLLGAMRFDGYYEAYYTGRYEPSLRFGREEDPKIFSLEWYSTVRLLDHARRVDFSFEIFWKTSGRRIRAAFPCGAPSDAGWYSIPGGWLERQRYEQTETFLWSPNGDWPALHFTAVKPGTGGTGWALVNYGTPSARIEDGAILMSLLRSPSFGHCLERYAQDYPMPTSGIRDGGWHHFTFSFMPHAGEKDIPRLSLDAAALNQAPPVFAAETGKCPPDVLLNSLSVAGECVELVSAKAPFSKGGDLILRLLNHSPRETEAAVSAGTAGFAKASEALLTEDIVRELPVKDGSVRVWLKGFEVKTLILSKQ